MKTYNKPMFDPVCNPDGAGGDEPFSLSEGKLSGDHMQNSFQQGNKKYRINPDFILREMSGDYAIVPVGSKNVFSNSMMVPNHTAVFLWKAFENASTIQDVVVHAMEKYDAEEGQIRESVEKFVKESLNYQVLEEVE